MSITIRHFTSSHHRKTISGATTEFTVHGHSIKRFEKHWSVLYPLCDLVQDIISHVKGPPLTSPTGYHV